MAQDPRSYKVGFCDVSQVNTIKNTTSSKDFIDSINKIGNIEALNDIGATKIGQGLRTLAGISNSVRTGTGVPPGILGIGGAVGGSIDAGANWVLDNVGIAPSAVQTVSNFNPGVANLAYGKAKQVFQDVKTGVFNENNIPSAFSAFQNLDQLAGSVYTPKSAQQSTQACFASPYAEALAYSYSPKFKFMFVVQISFNEQYSNSQYITVNGESLSEVAKRSAYLVKTSTRPSINFEYEEVNMYNFRTQTPKRTKYNNMSMSFYDDNMNQSMNFYTAYLNLISPISNIGQYGVPYLEDSGLDFNGTYNSASMRVLPDSDGLTSVDGPKNILSKITLYHLINFGQEMNVYEFFNPKILTLEQDELNMASSEITEVKFDFIYDSVHVVPGVPVNVGDQNTAALGRSIDIEQLTDFGKYPIKFNGGLA